MLKLPKRELILRLHQQGTSLRQIHKTTGVARATISKLITNQNQEHEKNHPTLDRHGHLIKEVLAACRGNMVRVHEILKTNHGLEIPYSTLTRIIREARLDKPVKKVMGFYQFVPGEEMQFDTSPHKVILDGKTHTLQCASLVFAYSRRIFVAYYHRFTRFEAKCFLHDALVFMDGSCRVCMIDNTSVVLAGGSGNEARISPEMEDQGRSYGYVFKAHPVGNPERKGRVERSFRYAENNFLVGRLFRSLKDLNEHVFGVMR